MSLVAQGALPEGRLVEDNLALLRGLGKVGEDRVKMEARKLRIQGELHADGNLGEPPQSGTILGQGDPP